MPAKSCFNLVKFEFVHFCTCGSLHSPPLFSSKFHYNLWCFSQIYLNLFYFCITEHNFIDITVQVGLKIKIYVSHHLSALILPIAIVIAIHVTCDVVYTKGVELWPFEFDLLLIQCNLEALL
jgi:hypothetical protein